MLFHDASTEPFIEVGVLDATVSWALGTSAGTSAHAQTSSCALFPLVHLPIDIFFLHFASFHISDDFYPCIASFPVETKIKRGFHNLMHFISH